LLRVSGKREDEDKEKKPHCGSLNEGNDAIKYESDDVKTSRTLCPVSPCAFSVCSAVKI
jgi:hypothetical protein